MSAPQRGRPARKGPVPSRTTTVTIRMTPELHDAAAKVAALTCRSTSSLMEYAVKLYITKNYPAAFNPEARVVLRLEEAPGEVAS